MANPEKKKKSNAGIYVFLPFVYIIAIIIIVVAAYFGSYSAAQDAADAGDFRKADKLLFLKPVTALHDELILQYVDAGVRLENGNYASARAGFENLLIYRNSEIYAKESTYREARYLTERYNGSGESSWLLSAAEKFRELRELEYADAAERFEQVLMLIYPAGIDAYHDGKYDAANELFNYFYEYHGDYEDIINYRTLTTARTQLYKNYLESKDLTEVDEQRVNSAVASVKAIWDFEDAPQVLVSNNYLACAFLCGRWRDADPSVFLELRYIENGQYSYGSTLPHDGGIFLVENSGFFTQQNGEYEKQFEITVLSPDTIELTCLKDGSIHTLRR